MSGKIHPVILFLSFFLKIFSQNSTESNQQLVGYRVTSLCCLPVSRMKNCCWKWEYIETTSMKQWSFIDRERRRKGKTNVRAKTAPNRREMNRCKYIKRMRWINFQLSMKSLDLNGCIQHWLARASFFVFFFFVLFQIRYQFGVCFVSLQPAVYSLFLCPRFQISRNVSYTLGRLGCKPVFSSSLTRRCHAHTRFTLRFEKKIFCLPSASFNRCTYFYREKSNWKICWPNNCFGSELCPETVQTISVSWTETREKMSHGLSSELRCPEQGTHSYRNGNTRGGQPEKKEKSVTKKYGDFILFFFLFLADVRTTSHSTTFSIFLSDKETKKMPSCD